MSRFCKFILWTQYTKTNGENPVYLRVTKDRKQKYIKLNISAYPTQWDEASGRYNLHKKTTKKGKQEEVENLIVHSEHEKLNSFLNIQEVEADKIINRYNEEKIDWTINQFEEAFLNKSKKGKVKVYFESLISSLKKTERIGNANCYSRTMNILELYDKNFAKRVFSEIDHKYVRGFDEWLQMPRQTVYSSSKGNRKVVQRTGCAGNTRKYYMKALRAILNRAIKDKEASINTYPFGKNGFDVAGLDKETNKRYLPKEYLIKIKNTKSTVPHLEFARKLFLFSYFSYGMSFVDMALLTDKDIELLDGGMYFKYTRHKTKNSKRPTIIKIKITDELQSLISDLQNMKQPVENYILPIITKEGYTGEQRYNHIRTRYQKYNNDLYALSTELGMDNINLTSYVSRHTMAMTLQSNEIPREVISQILGHKELKTTNAYLDSFDSSVIDEAVKGL